jgi:CheY-like chemotaxis protein
MVSLLAELGHRAECVANGAEALKVFCHTDAHWDLVLMDVEMPVLDGLAATQRLRAWEEKYCRNAVPVIALTGHDAHSHEDRIRQAGMDDHIVKPVELDRLHTVLARWLNNK